MFSKTFGYALRAVVYIAVHGKEGTRVGVMEIADRLKIPHHFLGKIMQDLVRKGVIDSAKGPTGGFYINAKTLEVPLMEILAITDGAAVFETCILGFEHCSSINPCPLHHHFVSCRNGMKQVFLQRKLGDLANDVDGGLAHLATVLS